MDVLAHAVRLVAPDRKVAIRNGHPELLIDLLQKAASHPTSSQP
jgi:3,4-dihydroxy-2-butanone 4-phosphate synthase